MQSLHSLVQQHPPQLASVAIGYNSNLDLIIHDAVSVFQALNLREPGDVHQDHQQIRSASDLQQTMAYWFAKVSIFSLNNLQLFKIFFKSYFAYMSLHRVALPSGL